MEDAEAERVLRALGPQLTWQEKWSDDGHGFHFYLIYIGLSPRGDVYNVHRRSGIYAGKWTASRIVSDVSGSSEGEVFHPTLEAAKADCERHHATGKWE